MTAKTEPKWKWAIAVDLNKEKCAAACGEPLRAYTSTLVAYRGRTWHVHCLLDHLVEKDPTPEAPPGQPVNFQVGWWGGGGVTP